MPSKTLPKRKESTQTGRTPHINPHCSSGPETEAEKTAKKAQIKLLEESIARREKLLANDNYVKKAPEKIVELDRKKLEEEKKKLEELKK